MCPCLEVGFLASLTGQALIQMNILIVILVNQGHMATYLIFSGITAVGSCAPNIGNISQQYQIEKLLQGFPMSIIPFVMYSFPQISKLL